MLVLGGLAWWLLATQRATAPSSTQVPGNETPDLATSAGATRATAPAGADTGSTNSLLGQALPPAGAPANLMVDDLLSRARAGDSRAACRLGAELIRCRMVMSSLEDIMQTETVQQALAEPDRNDTALDPDQANLAMVRIDATKGCMGIAPELVAQGPKWLRSAALAGENDALVLYADGAGLEGAGHGGLAFFRDVGFDAWRREAPGMMWRALRQGSPDAVRALQLAYSADYAPFAGLVPDDPAQAAALGALADALRGRPISATTGGSAAARAEAERQGRALFQGHFGGMPLPEGATMASAWGALSTVGAVTHAACSTESPAADTSSR